VKHLVFTGFPRFLLLSCSSRYYHSVVPSMGDENKAEGAPNGILGKEAGKSAQDRRIYGMITYRTHWRSNKEEFEAIVTTRAGKMYSLKQDCYDPKISPFPVFHTIAFTPTDETMTTSQGDFQIAENPAQIRTKLELEVAPIGRGTVVAFKDGRTYIMPEGDHKGTFRGLNYYPNGRQLHPTSLKQPTVGTQVIFSTCSAPENPTWTRITYVGLDERYARESIANSRRAVLPHEITTSINPTIRIGNFDDTKGEQPPTYDAYDIATTLQEKGALQSLTLSKIMTYLQEKAYKEKAQLEAMLKSDPRMGDEVGFTAKLESARQNDRTLRNIDQNESVTILINSLPWDRHYDLQTGGLFSMVEWHRCINRLCESAISSIFEVIITHAIPRGANSDNMWSISGIQSLIYDNHTKSHFQNMLWTGEMIHTGRVHPVAPEKELDFKNSDGVSSIIFLRYTRELSFPDGIPEMIQGHLPIEPNIELLDEDGTQMQEDESGSATRIRTHFYATATSLIFSNYTGGKGKPPDRGGGKAAGKVTSTKERSYKRLRLFQGQKRTQRMERDFPYWRMTCVAMDDRASCDAEIEDLNHEKQKGIFLAMRADLLLNAWHADDYSRTHHCIITFVPGEFNPGALNILFPHAQICVTGSRTVRMMHPSTTKKDMLVAANDHLKEINSSPMYQVYEDQEGSSLLLPMRIRGQAWKSTPFVEASRRIDGCFIKGIPRTVSDSRILKGIIKHFTGKESNYDKAEWADFSSGGAVVLFLPDANYDDLNNVDTLRLPESGGAMASIHPATSQIQGSGMPLGKKAATASPEEIPDDLEAPDNFAENLRMVKMFKLQLDQEKEDLASSSASSSSPSGRKEGNGNGKKGAPRADPDPQGAISPSSPSGGEQGIASNTNLANTTSLTHDDSSRVPEPSTPPVQGMAAKPSPASNSREQRDPQDKAAKDGDEPSQQYKLSGNQVSLAPTPAKPNTTIASPGPPKKSKKKAKRKASASPSEGSAEASATDKPPTMVSSPSSLTSPTTKERKKENKDKKRISAAERRKMKKLKKAAGKSSSSSDSAHPASSPAADPPSGGPTNSPTNPSSPEPTGRSRSTRSTSEAQGRGVPKIRDSRSQSPGPPKQLNHGRHFGNSSDESSSTSEGSHVRRSYSASGQRSSLKP
jgi:hypothetical protein